MGEQSALDTLIRKARFRHAFQVFVRETIFASSVALGGLILLILIGTKFLSPWWLVPLFTLSLLIGLYRAKTRIRNSYQLAQRLDDRLGLQDQLSTAVYFGEHDGHAPKPSIERQRAAAEEAARGVDLKLGLPFPASRSIYVASSLALIAASLFAVRFGVTRTLNLRASLVQIAFEGLLGTPEATAGAGQKKLLAQRDSSDRPKEDALTVDPWESKALDAQGPPDNALNTVDVPNVNNPNLNTDNNTKANVPSPDPVQQPGETTEEGDKQAAAADQSGDTSSASNKEGSKPGKQQGAEQQDKNGNSSGENSSLADKMRDALSNLMSKLTQQKPNESNKASKSQPGQNAQKQGNRDEKGSQQAGKQSDAMSSPDQQGDQEGQSSDKSASAQNKSGKNSDKPPTQDGKSGVGKEDGDKSAREAEQLAAMGKISEIIGKRAANMTGEVLVEVSSGKQQLRTQYSQHNAAHTDAGGEINRDEVPLAYQQFVQQYFEEIRKTTAGGGQGVKAKKTPGT